MDELRELSARIPDAMTYDRPRLRRRAGAVQSARARGRTPADELAALRRDLERSLARVEERRARAPRPTFPQDLPVLARRDEITDLIARNQVVVLCGETGSGKTTQLPKICLDLGRGIHGLIGHTQPRRIAARTVAARLAEELHTRVGEGVGFKVRFGDETGPDSVIKVMTDGILLAETQGDRLLEQYDTLIIDEAHERSLNIDFLLGYLHQLLPRRPDLKLIITSATIDPQRFSDHFNGAPIIEVSGRTYPVEVRYRPPEAGEDEEGLSDERVLERAICDAVAELAREPGETGRGDVLVFLPGEREIRNAAEALRKHYGLHHGGLSHAASHARNAGIDILPLYSRLSAQEQLRVFAPHPGRRIVLATNVAETSLTVPGIRAVVDTGAARISRYSARTKVQRLPIEPVSRASADQRKGRCGRVAPGVCIRLYGQDDFEQRPQFTDPEIVRTNLASVILQMKSLRLGEPERFPFIDPPDSRMIRDGYDTLHELGAIDERGELTDLGRRLARLPVDPRIGRMILAGEREHCLHEVLVIASALSIQDPRERPVEKQNAADDAHKRFHHEHSDFLALLNLWRWYRDASHRLSSSALRAELRAGFLSVARMREWHETHQQLLGLATEIGLRVPPPTSKEPPYDALHRALLTGLLANVGTRGETFDYKGTRAGKFSIFPGSGLFKKPPRWVMAAEIVETTRRYARTVAKIEPEWIEDLARHVVARSYTEEHWSRDSGTVVATERVLLWGLEIVPRRRVHFGPIDPAKSRDVFVHHALVEGDSDLRGPWREHNDRLLEEVARLQAKARTPDILADKGAIHAFFDARVPPGVYSTHTFDHWRKEAERRDPKVLFLTRDHVMRRAEDALAPERFPDTIERSGTRLRIDYVFDPGAPDDGVSITVPLEALLTTDADQGEWLVPGRLEEKVLALFKTLPKGVRKDLDPLPDVARAAATDLPFAEGSLLDALAARVKTLRGAAIPRTAWQPRAVPDHLRMLYVVVDERAKELARSRDLDELKARFEKRARESFERLARKALERDGVTSWDFGDLPESVDIERRGLAMKAYPALVDTGNAVAVRVMDSPVAAASATRAGLRRLFVLRAKDELTYQVRLTPSLQAMALHFGPVGSPEELKRELTDAIAERAFLAGRPPVRTRQQFDQRLTEGWSRISAARAEVVTFAEQVLGARHAAALKLGEPHAAGAAQSIADITAHLGSLVTRNFLTAPPPDSLPHLPRYVSGVRLRLDKLRSGGLARDLKAMQEIAPLYVRWHGALTRAQASASGAGTLALLEQYRWMLEELRVSLFAQELGVPAPVSVKRLDEQWTKMFPALSAPAAAGA